ncbi:MAG: hypothetical protein AB1918_06720 [Pseudomonadota bacterium]
MLRILADWLRPRDMRSPDGLAEFIGTETSRIAQKATTGYCRTKAGANVELLFKEKVFLDALEVSRWSAFGLVLADICLVAEGYLRPFAKGREDALAAWITGVFDAHLDANPRPGTEGDDGEGDRWAAERAEFRARLARSRMAEPIPAANVGFDTAQRIYDGLPVHPKLRREDFELVQNLMRFGHIAFREELERHLDAEAVLAALPKGSDGDGERR